MGKIKGIVRVVARGGEAFEKRLADPGLRLDALEDNRRPEGCPGRDQELPGRLAARARSPGCTSLSCAAHAAEFNPDA